MDKDVIFGDVELDDLELEPRHVKVRVTTMLDEDVLNALKKIASAKGQKVSAARAAFFRPAINPIKETA